MTYAFLEEALRIADRISAAAIFHRDAANWVVRRPTLRSTTREHDRPAAQTLPAHMHTGTAGIAIFLARAWKESGSREHRAAARGAIEHALTHAAAEDPAGRFGLYTGALGVSWVAWQVGEALGDPSILRRARALADAALERRGPAKHDVMSGAAGGILALLDLEARGARPPEGAAAKLGDRLLRAARIRDQEWSWPVAAKGGAHLMGLSHGAAGVALAMAALHRSTDDVRHLEAARGALRFERSRYDPDRMGWPRLDRDGPEGAMVAWCHGAPGVGVSRAILRRLWPDDVLLKESELALGTTIDHLRALVGLPGYDHALCHGTLGTVECAMIIDDALGGSQQGELRKASRLAIERYGHASRVIYGGTLTYPSQVAAGHLDPSLFGGEAGIGHHFLHVHVPRRAPSLLAPPFPA